MNKYHQNIIAIFFLVIIYLFLFSYWLNLSFGYGQILLIVGGGYGVYLNLKAVKKERKNVSTHP